MKSRSVHLVILEGPEEGRAIELPDPGALTLGRGAGSDVLIGEPTLSAVHCRLSANEGVVTIEDLGSSNGTWVNDGKVTSRVLGDGDILLLGALRVVLRAGSLETPRVDLDLSGVPTARFNHPLGSRHPSGAAFPAGTSTENPRPGRLSDMGALNLLFEVGKIANSHEETGGLLARVLEAIRLRVGAARVVYCWEGEGAGEPVYDMAPGLAAAVPRVPRHVHEAVRAGRTVVLSFPDECDRRGAGRTVHEQGIRSLVCIPVLAGDELLGSLYADMLVEGESFDERTAGVLSAAGDILAAALLRDRAARIARDLESRLRERENLALIGVLSSGVAHDLANVLTCLDSYAQVAVEDPKAAQELPVRVLRICEKGHATVRSILASAGRSKERGTLFDAKELMHDVAILVGAEMRSGAVSVEEEYQEGGYLVNGNPGEIQDAVLNLCMNARHAMPKGGVLTLTVAPSGGQVRMSVRDTGVGIPPEGLARLFRLLETSRRGAAGGTGLGLYRVQGIVAAHGGEVSVESEVGQGSRFDILLPRVARGATAKTARK